jgi:pentatricopeptide repeat protein
LFSEQAKSMEAQSRTLEARINYSRLDIPTVGSCDGFDGVFDLKSVVAANGDWKKTMTADGKPLTAASTDHYMLYSFFLKGCGGAKKYELARTILDQMVAQMPTGADGRELQAICD